VACASRVPLDGVVAAIAGDAVDLSGEQEAKMAMGNGGNGYGERRRGNGARRDGAENSTDAATGMEVDGANGRRGDGE
jgi:hypothetical protein